MITVDTCGTTAYSPLIPAIKAICEAPFGETLEIIMNHADAFQDLKEYLSVYVLDYTPAEPARLLWPINQGALTNNPLLKQTVGY